MRILILINNDVGLYKFRRELIESMVAANHEVHISLPDGEYVKKLEDIGCIYHETKFERRSTNVKDDFKLLIYYKKIIKRIKPDVILTYTIKPNIYGGIAANQFKIPYIMNITGLGSTLQNKDILSMIITTLYKIACNGSKRVFFQNEPNKLFFTEEKIVNEGKTKLIPGSGVNLNFHPYEEYPVINGDLKFLFIGRLMRDKGVCELVESAKIIKSRYNNVEFNLIGQCEEEFIEEFNLLNEDNVVTWHGQQDDVHSYIKTHHATILASYHEGMANVLLESASSGRPVLASKIPGCNETFDEGISGFGFEKKNIASLVEVIEKFIELPYDKKAAMGIAGRKKVEKEFDRNIIINSYMEEMGKFENELVRKNSK